MATVHQLSRQDARRVAVRAQMLTSQRPPDLLTVVRRLTMLQLDPVSAVAPSADLVAWSRLGAAYQPDDLQGGGGQTRASSSCGPSCARPRTSALYRAEMAAWPGAGEAAGLAGIPTASGWRPTTSAGATSSPGSPRAGRCRPGSSPTLREAVGVHRLDQQQERDQAAGVHGVAAARSRSPAARGASGCGTSPSGSTPTTRSSRRPRRRGSGTGGGSRPSASPAPSGPETLWSRGIVGAAPASRPRSRASRGEWRVDPSYLDGNAGAGFAGRAALLSPFDRLVHDRVRALDVFEYEYQLEMYKPVAKRRWGYYALPVLYGDRLVGKLDATADRKAGVLRSTPSTRTSRSPRRCPPRSTRRSPASPPGWSWRSGAASVSPALVLKPGLKSFLRQAAARSGGRRWRPPPPR